MISTVVFSRDRPAQLDLLLRSIRQNADRPLDPIDVIWKATNSSFTSGYGMCSADHPDVRFWAETEFRHLVESLVRAAGPHIMFLCDDDVLYRPLEGEPTPEQILDAEPDVLCVSLRLGQNTGTCYPMRRIQGLPVFAPLGRDALLWPWRLGDGDFGYPGSLDGHVFRSDYVPQLLTTRVSFSDPTPVKRPYLNPNTLEDQLMLGCLASVNPLMGCYRESRIVGVPVNSVTETHPGNRNGDAHGIGVRALNDRFLRGERIALKSIKPDRVTGAHTEFKLGWER